MDKQNSVHALGVRAATSRIRPQMLRSEITSLTTLPVLSLASMPQPGSTAGTAPMTIFYKDTLTIFHVPQNKAEMIMKLAEGGNVGAVIADMLLLGARRKSLQRFLEKRKQRMTTSMPYDMDIHIGTKFMDMKMITYANV